MFRFKEEAQNSTKSENMGIVKDLLMNLPKQIEQIREYEIGINCSFSPTAYNMVLISAFDDENSLNIYRKHPAHLSVLNTINNVCSELAVVDYYI